MVSLSNHEGWHALRNDVHRGRSPCAACELNPAGSSTATPRSLRARWSRRVRSIPHGPRPAPFPRAPAIGRVEEYEVERTHRPRRSRRSHRGAEAGYAADPESLDMVADEPPRLRTGLNETTEDAPRESASRPMAPVPAKRSSTRRPSKLAPRRLARMSKIDSRTRSAVGRIESSEGAIRCLPRKRPAMMRMP